MERPSPGRPTAERRVMGMPASWFAFVTAPLVWATFLLVDYVFLAWGCEAGGTSEILPGLQWVEAVLFLLTLLGCGLILWSMKVGLGVWRGVEATERPGDPGHEGRRGFLGFAGLFWGALFLTGTLLFAANLLALGCEGAP